MSPEVGIPLLTLVLVVMATAQALYEPKDRYKKILVLVSVIVVGLVLFVVTVIQGLDNKAEAQENKATIKRLEEAAKSGQKEFREFRGEIVTTLNEADKLGAADEKLNKILDGLNKALGKPRDPVPIYQPGDTKPIPIATGTATMKAVEGARVLSPVVTATSKIQVGGVGDHITGSLHVTNIVPGVSFDIVSSEGGDEGKVFWIMYP